VFLRLDRHFCRLVAWVAAGFALFATVALAWTALTARGVQVSAGTCFVVGPAAAGLVVLGPWLGPMINPGGQFGVAWRLTAVALPVLIGSLAPFVLRRRAVTRGAAAVAWCGFLTALLFWIAAGVLSLGWSMG
jgi:hypothetical protein